MSLHLEIEKCKEHLSRVYEIAHEFNAEEFKDPACYLSAMEDLCKIIDNDKRCNAALELAKERATNIDEFDRIYVEELRKQKKTNPKKTAEYKQFAASLNVTQNVAATNEDDLVMNAEVNVYDPLSKQRMENPVKNRLCGHHYEKLTILEAIKINWRLRCPVAGCGNKEFVTESHLQEDIEFRKQLSLIAHDDDLDD